tara:strand:- start:259 stop:579 length:321 start_codon:yes stop_codon:yes gene_type:complete
MIQAINEWDFRNAFKSTIQYRDDFSYEGLKALYDYLEQYEEDTGEQIELDVIAICCEYTEYEDLKEFEDVYGKEFSNIDKRFKYSIEDKTTLIPIEGTDGFIIQNF